MRLDRETLAQSTMAARELAARDCCETSLLRTYVNCGSDALLQYDAYETAALVKADARRANRLASGCKTLAIIFFMRKLDTMYLDTHIETQKQKSVEFERRSTRKVLDVADAVPSVDRVRHLSSGIALVREAAVQAPIVEQEHVAGL